MLHNNATPTARWQQQAMSCACNTRFIQTSPGETQCARCRGRVCECGAYKLPDNPTCKNKKCIEALAVAERRRERADRASNVLSMNRKTKRGG